MPSRRACLAVSPQRFPFSVDKPHLLLLLFFDLLVLDVPADLLGIQPNRVNTVALGCGDICTVDQNICHGKDCKGPMIVSR